MVTLYGTEFHKLPNGTVEFRTLNGIPELIQIGSPIVREMLRFLQDYYPHSYNALSLLYVQSIKHIQYYEYLIVLRFIKCNWGNFDGSFDIDLEGNCNFEICDCPLWGECPNRGIICNPKRRTGITQSEMRVLEKIVEGLTPMEQAKTLCLSVFTVDNHRKKMLRKLGFNKESQLVNYYHKHCKKQLP